MPQYNRAFTIRSGFDYQDLWTLKLCGEWLLSPDKYKWIQIEANPTEEREFYLDDIVLLDSSDLLHLYQVKFKANPQYHWTWDDILKPQNRASESLLKKWSKSFDDKKTKKAALITNGTFSNEIMSFLSDSKLTIQKLKKENPDLYKQIESEIGNENFVETFFQKFEFYFENRAINEIEKVIIENLFLNSIRATIDGINNLLLQIKREAREKHTLQLTLDQIKAWCKFDKPRLLNEKFEIPSDFQFFNKNTHENILRNFLNPEGGVKVIFGKPGTGKSVYLSRLSEELKNKGVVVIKHHYHISPSDSSPFERLVSERVVEAIKAQFKKLDYKEYLGELANKNSREVSLREFVSSVAQNVSRDNKNFVIIIDGLDHVVREKDIYELRNFLDEVFYPQKGLWIIFGTQPQVRNENVLQAIFSKCSKENWIEIKGLNIDAVFQLIRKNTTDLNLPDNQRCFKELVDKLYEISQGNPLHLRYILIQLKNRLANRSVTQYECNDLIPYGDNIEKYYQSLWNTLKEEIKTFLLTFISVDFQFIREQFIECISSFNLSSTSITQNFKKVEHLIASDPRRKLSIYHNSFKLFLYEQADWKEQKKSIKDKVKRWVESSNYENLKWAELRKLEYELENDSPIQAIDRKWLIEAIIHPRNPSQIESQLNLSSRVAFDKNDFAKALKISYTHTYYQNAQDFVEETAKLIWIESIKSNPNFIDNFIFSELPSEVLVVVVDIANRYGKFYIIDEIIEILQERLGYQEYRVGEIPLATKAIIQVIPHDRRHEAERVYKYIIQFRDLGISSVLFKFYAEKLLFLDQKTRIDELLQFDLNKEERKEILECYVKQDLKQKTSQFANVIEKEENNSLLEQIYLILQGRKLSLLPELPEQKDFPFTIPEYDSERAKWKVNFYNFFLTGLIYALCNKQGKIEEWISYSSSQWCLQATIALFKSALKIANTIKRENKIDYRDIFNELNTISNLKWPEDRDRLEFKFALKNALINILRDLVLIKLFLNDSPRIDEENYKSITSSPFFLQNDSFELVLNLEQPILEKDIYNTILSDKIKSLENTVNHFPERSEEYAKLASFSKLYQENEKAKDLLAKAADNFLGYGCHKDTYLFDVLEAIEFCAEAGIDSEKINNWIHRIIPLIANVGEYTDGDETNHLPNYLADSLSKNNKKILFKFCFVQADKEELYPAQDLFKYIISSIAFTEDVEIALATTALDKKSLKALKEKAKISEGAQASLNIIQEYLGKINYKDEDYSRPYDIKEEKINYAQVTPKRLEEHLGNLKSRWDFEKYINGWTKYWLEQEDKQKIYNLIKSIVLKKVNIRSVSGEILDILYPLAYEFDNSEAFTFLCSAQTNDHGWARYWTDKKKAEERWRFVKEEYPERYLEFFKSSANYSVPLSRGVEFFIRFNDVNKAEVITEASINFAESLMADLNLQYPIWAKEDFQEVDELDLLFQRLVWPSPLVRERAATATGKLLAYSAQKEEIYKRLLKWINNWRIESIIAIGLLAVIKAFQLCKKKVDLAFISINDINKSIQANSIVIEELLTEIASQSGEEIKEFPNYISPRQPPVSYKLSSFFNKYIKTILAPIYLNRAQEIKEKTGKSFIEIWAYNVGVIAEENKIEFESNYYFYGSHKNGKFLTGFSTKVSEVYRSAFLRVLREFYNNELIQKDFYLEYSFATLPVDLSYWSIFPSRIPEWWPKLISYKTDNEEKAISTIQFKEPVENMIQYKKDNKIILAAEGAVEPSEGWTENPTHSFSLIGFGYKVLGANLPEAKEATRKILFAPQTLIIPTKAERPIGFFNNSAYFDIHSDSIQIKNLIVYPLVTRNRDLTISLWQYFRDKDPSFNINERLRSRLRIVFKNNKRTYEDKDIKEVVVFEDWLEGLQERYEFDMPNPHGHYILIDYQYLMTMIKKNSLRLGYFLQTTYRTRKYSHDKIQEITENTFIDVSNIIVSF